MLTTVSCPLLRWKAALTLGRLQSSPPLKRAICQATVLRQVSRPAKGHLHLKPHPVIILQGACLMENSMKVNLMVHSSRLSKLSVVSHLPQLRISPNLWGSKETPLMERLEPRKTSLPIWTIMTSKLTACLLPLLLQMEALSLTPQSPTPSMALKTPAGNATNCTPVSLHSPAKFPIR